MKTFLHNALQAQIALQRFRFHVPGHAGRGFVFPEADIARSLYPYDLTELPPLDVLGDPSGVLRDSQQAVAELFGVRQSYYLINGASVGMMAALLASGVTEGDHVLLARNCHRSVIQGLVLSGATPHWILPDTLPNWGLWGQICPERLASSLAEHPEIGLFVMTHPTYEGIASDVKAIAEVCRQYHVKLIVDEAHGSLWPLHDSFPTSAIEAGADAVVHSLHKSAGSLTQTALLHLPNGSRLEPQAVQQALNLLQTTSPSYVLLANLEATCAFLAAEAGRARVQGQLVMASSLRTWIRESLTTIAVLEPTRGENHLHLFLKSRKYPGEAFAELLEETYGIAFEAATSHGVLLLLNLGLEAEAITALQSALTDIDKRSHSLPDTIYPEADVALPQTRMTPREAFFAEGQVLPIEQCTGKIAKQVIAACPPGIPVLMPGEVITEKHRPFLPETVHVTHIG